MTDLGPKAEQLLQHAGHDIEVSWYGDRKDPADVTIECSDCHEVLISCESDFGDDRVWVIYSPQEKLFWCGEDGWGHYNTAQEFTTDGMLDATLPSIGQKVSPLWMTRDQAALMITILCEEEDQDISSDPDKLYTVWVGGTEVNDHYLPLTDAERLADKYREDGYDDVAVQEKDDA